MAAGEPAGEARWISFWMFLGELATWWLGVWWVLGDPTIGGLAETIRPSFCLESLKLKWLEPGSPINRIIVEVLCFFLSLSVFVSFSCPFLWRKSRWSWCKTWGGRWSWWGWLTGWECPWSGAAHGVRNVFLLLQVWFPTWSFSGFRFLHFFVFDLEERVSLLSCWWSPIFCKGNNMKRQGLFATLLCIMTFVSIGLLVWVSQKDALKTTAACDLLSFQVYLAYEYSKHSTDSCDVPLQLWVQVPRSLCKAGL